MKKLICIPILFLSGCAYYQPIGISSSSVGSQYERPSGIAEGVSRRWSFFPCYNACPIGDDSLKSAMNNALAGKAGDALVNVYAERKTVAFPHIYFPLIIRSDVVITGTVVKYTTKEFPPDNEEYLYSGNVSIIWRGLLFLKAEEQALRINVLNSEMRNKLIEYAEAQVCAIKENSPEETLFASICGRKAKRCGFNTYNSVVPSEPCKMYYCMALLNPADQVVQIKELKQSVTASDVTAFSNIVKAAQKRVRACRNGQIFVEPETILSPGETELLSFLCKDGELK
ncbi:MAG: hypothetical protein NTY45_10645 [Elusimicrobia bacterium]|nr:hypothetical protein [Elusimicrobiota bacterium]